MLDRVSEPGPSIGRGIGMPPITQHDMSNRYAHACSVLENMTEQLHSSSGRGFSRGAADIIGIGKTPQCQSVDPDPRPAPAAGLHSQSVAIQRADLFGSVLDILS
jgi:hypothetical protein